MIQHIATEGKQTMPILYEVLNTLTVRVTYDRSDGRRFVRLTFSDDSVLLVNNKKQANEWLKRMSATPCAGNKQACVHCGLLVTYGCPPCDVGLCQSCWDAGKMCSCEVAA